MNHGLWTADHGPSWTIMDQHEPSCIFTNYQEFPESPRIPTKNQPKTFRTDERPELADNLPLDYGWPEHADAIDRAIRR